MKTFKQFIEESYINLIHDDPRKDQHKDEVHNMIQKAYEKIGGIHGSGFASPDDMKNIHMWKLSRSQGKLKAVALYKDKGGRKSVAVATDGTEEGKEHLARIVKADAKTGRSYSEKSGPSLSFLKRQVGSDHLQKIAHSFDDVRNSSDEEIRRPPENDPEIIKHPELRDHFYQRQIGDHWHTKIMLGSKGKKIE
jgi:hypothetical protein